MPERSVNLGAVVATILWSLSAAFILAGTMCGFTISDSTAGLAATLTFMCHGLVLSAGAATVTVRNGLETQSRLMVDAFQMGHEVGQSVRRIGK